MDRRCTDLRLAAGFYDCVDASVGVALGVEAQVDDACIVRVADG